MSALAWKGVCWDLSESAVKKFTHVFLGNDICAVLATQERGSEPNLDCPVWKDGSVGGAPRV